MVREPNMTIFTTTTTTRRRRRRTRTRTRTKHIYLTSQYRNMSIHTKLTGKATKLHRTPTHTVCHETSKAPSISEV